MRFRIITALALGITALTTALVATGPARAAEPTEAAGNGRACLFVSPTAVFGLGHVGWAVMDGSGRWYSGATETKSSKGFAGNWLRGPEDVNSMLKHFSAQRLNNDPYQRFRCVNTPNGSPGNAVAKFRQLMSTDYAWATNNCLTRSVATFKAYTSALNGLDDGAVTAPNSYFNRHLTAWSWENPVSL
ncbi:hypothetical protein HLK59_40765 [Streptomyces sp. S3(2020)]|uniref:hypothetical protein n=1 Tax=Streptomyces sp. S3(2020) TaxID=2732044 RepID=UPI0014890DF7|nr:hypothetical protein [Streptomyces sp. S3(2020)]NNN36583.1 hypothetical protein [Streptomyces sp. S3(2020)]